MQNLPTIHEARERSNEMEIDHLLRCERENLEQIDRLETLNAGLRARVADLEDSIAAVAATLSDVTRAAAALLADLHWTKIENARLDICLDRYLTNEYGSLDESSVKPARTYRPRRPPSGSRPPSTPTRSTRSTPESAWI